MELVAAGSPLERVRRWLREGVTPRGTLTYDCPRCDESVTLSLILENARPRLGFLSDLKRQGSLHAEPGAYVMLGAAGLAIGVLWGRAVGWPWWWGPGVAVGAGWLVVVSSIFWDAVDDDVATQPVPPG